MIHERSSGVGGSRQRGNGGVSSTAWFASLPRVFVSVVVLSFGLACPVLAQRSDRATISGVVSDALASAVPGATVAIHNQNTGVDTVLVTNDAGAYTTPPLVPGTYVVTIRLDGFKTSLSAPILLEGGLTIRHDVTLEVGQINENVQVRSGERLSDTRPDVSHTVDQKYYADLPFITGGDVRLAESALQMQPGYLPIPCRHRAGAHESFSTAGSATIQTTTGMRSTRWIPGTRRRSKHPAPRAIMTSESAVNSVCAPATSLPVLLPGPARATGAAPRS